MTKVTKNLNPVPCTLHPEPYHTPVLLDKILEYLVPRSGGIYLDGTIGEGGHSESILLRSNPDGRLIGIDLDPTSLRRAGERLSPFRDRVRLIKGNFSNAKRILSRLMTNGVDGILLDLGVGSFQLNDKMRGFSFLGDGPLDMRFDPDCTVSAHSLINNLPKEKLKEIIFRFGEEKDAGRISRFIEKARSRGPIDTTRELADIVIRAKSQKKYKGGRIHPATRVFQAIRIAVNKELEALEEFLKDLSGLLNIGGRVCIISFHSLEDRLVKGAFRDRALPCRCPPEIPECICQSKVVLRILTRRPVVPSRQEVSLNPRARSAKLRVAERI